MDGAALLDAPALRETRTSGHPLSAQARILVVLPSMAGGGAERLHLALAKQWRARGIEVDFALMQRRGELLSLITGGIRVFDLEAHRIRQVVPQLRQLLRQQRPDVVLAAMWPLTTAAVLAWRLAGKPGRLFLSDHTQLSVACIEELKIPAYFLRAAMRLTYPLASGLVAVSEGVKRDMCKLGGFSDSQVEVIYNPVATGVAPTRESDEVRKALWGTGFDHHVLSIGTLKTQKDQSTLLKAFARLPSALNAKLTILGEGSVRSELEDLVVRLGLQNKVAMPGFVIDPYPWLRSADLFVLSSRWEGFGNVIVEALECGVPVVSTDCPSGPSEILKDGRYGKLVPIRDPVALGSAMEQTLTETHDSDALIRRAQDFSVSRIADEYLAYFRNGT